MSVVYKTEIMIDADADSVYRKLVDVENYANWNPWLVRAEGVCEVGSVIEVDVKLGNKLMTVQHEILEMIPGKLFKWQDLGWFTTVAFGQRTRTMEVLPEGGVLYRNELVITGLMSRLADLTNGTAVKNGMAAENEALKRVLES